MNPAKDDYPAPCGDCATYAVRLTHTVEVRAHDQFAARAVAAETLMNGGYTESFEMFAEIADVERMEGES